MRQPVFISPAAFSAPENQTVVATVTASDPENDAFAFGLAGGADVDFFSINMQTGALSFLTAPDFETPEDANHDNVYNVIVSATDVLGDTSTQAIDVTVANVTETGRAFNGGNGDDNLIGTLGNDTMSGGSGNDHLEGRDGNDSMSGGNGNDRLDGGRGNDALTGDNGTDMFVFAAGFGHDVVTDFEDGDHIEFDGALLPNANFQSVLALSQQQGNNTVITLDANNRREHRATRKPTRSYRCRARSHMHSSSPVCGPKGRREKPASSRVPPIRPVLAICGPDASFRSGAKPSRVCAAAANAVTRSTVS
jgi:Ca2+-binding RTX toxin-like protein